MNRKGEKQTRGKRCPICGYLGLREIREDTIFGGVWIENVPFEHCPSCDDRYCDLATSQTLEAIADNPSRYAKMLKRPVARVA